MEPFPHQELVLAALNGHSKYFPPSQACRLTGVRARILPESSCPGCKTNGRECEHGLCRALMAVQVCLMSRRCDYQRGALVRLEAPQVNRGGEAGTCTAGGPRTALMVFHLLPGR